MGQNHYNYEYGYKKNQVEGVGGNVQVEPSVYLLCKQSCKLECAPCTKNNGQDAYNLFYKPFEDSNDCKNSNKCNNDNVWYTYIHILLIFCQK